MKKKIIYLLSSFLLITGLSFAQDGRQLQTPEERAQATLVKMEPLKLTDEVKKQTETILVDFYKSVQEAMREMRESGTGDREAMMTKRAELVKVRDEKLAKIFSAEQFKIWKADVEPTTLPQRNRP